MVNIRKTSFTLNELMAFKEKLFIILLIFTTPLALQQLWILAARFNSLHFHANADYRELNFH